MQSLAARAAGLGVEAGIVPAALGLAIPPGVTAGPTGVVPASGWAGAHATAATATKVTRTAMAARRCGARLTA